MKQLGADNSGEIQYKDLSLETTTSWREDATHPFGGSRDDMQAVVGRLDVHPLGSGGKG